ncbi:MAG TPA: hypothetical protein VFY26_01535 [Anaerolineales bacterium]|nr:hypothetical protein [Anaerolineales bacterium]
MAEVPVNKTDSMSPARVYSAASHLEPGTANRLIVLVPTDSDYTSEMRRIVDLAVTSGARVLLLGLCKDSTQELGLRRGLITLSALLQDTGVCADVKVEIGMNWTDIVKSSYRVGDKLICFAEQPKGLSRGPLTQIVDTDLGAPVFLLSAPVRQSRTQSNWLSKIAAWAGFLAVITFAFLLQTQIMSLPGGWAQTTLLILSVAAELWLIWVWNDRFG